MNRHTVRSMVGGFILASAALVVLAGIPGSAVGTGAQQTSKIVRCQEVRRHGEWPEYTNSGVWSSDGRRLFLLDNAHRRLLEFSVAGKSEGRVYGELAKRLKEGIPRKVASLEGGGFYIQTDENRFTVATPKAIDDVVADPSSLGIISKIYNFTVVKDEVVALADVEVSENTWQRGFVVFPMAQPKAFRWLLKGVSTEERVFYRLAFSYMATLGNTAYVLRMETRPELYLYRKGNSSLEAVDAFEPYAMSHFLPELPPFRLPTDYEPLMHVVERSHMPVGLYGWEGRLYLLERSWTGRKTTWNLVVLDPGNPRKDLHSIAIGVEAEHLFLVPGKLRWGLVTKAHPTSLQSQEVTGMQFFPSAALQRDSLPARLCK